MEVKPVEPFIKKIPTFRKGETNWLNIAEKLPIDKSDQNEIRLRNQLWRQFDYNGNGMLSLSEAHTGLRKFLSDNQLK